MAWNNVKQNVQNQEIIVWCDSVGISNYTITREGKIDVDGSVYLNRRKVGNIIELPYKFGKVKDSFYVNFKNLRSLKNCPDEVGGDFSCNGCKNLTSLTDSPKTVGGHFYCDGCDSLKTLEGAPETVGGTFDCYNCGVQFTEDDVKKVSKVKGRIYI